MLYVAKERLWGLCVGEVTRSPRSRHVRFARTKEAGKRQRIDRVSLKTTRRDRVKEPAMAVGAVD